LREKKTEEIAVSSLRLLDCSTQADWWGASAAPRGWRWLQKDSPMASLASGLAAFEPESVLAVNGRAVLRRK